MSRLVANGFLVMLLKSNANNPVLFGIIFKAKSDKAEITLLFYGFFNETLDNISPETLRSLRYFANVIAIKDPAPCPK